MLNLAQDKNRDLKVEAPLEGAYTLTHSLGREFI